MAHLIGDHAPDAPAGMGCIPVSSRYQVDMGVHVRLDRQNAAVDS